MPIRKDSGPDQSPKKTSGYRNARIWTKKTSLSTTSSLTIGETAGVTYLLTGNVEKIYRPDSISP